MIRFFIKFALFKKCLLAFFGDTLLGISIEVMFAACVFIYF